MRAILVDTSASMHRLTSDGTPALQQARAIAQRVLDSARVGIIFETYRPGANVTATASWLQNHSGLRELVIVSDFQLGAVMDGNLAGVPADIGVKLVRVADSAIDVGRDSTVGVRVQAQSSGTSASWSISRPDTGLSVRILAADGDGDAVKASIATVRAIVPRHEASRHPVAVVFPGYATRQALEAQVAPLDSAWQGDLLSALRRDEKLSRYAQSAWRVMPCELPGTPFAGDLFASVARGSGAEPGLLVFTCVQPGTPAGTALLAVIESAISPTAALDEIEPTFVPDDVLRRWERPAVRTAPPGEEQTSPDGRWLWLLAVVLLLVEEFVRWRSSRAAVAPATERPNERVA